MYSSFKRKDISEEFYSISGKLIKFTDGYIILVNIYGDRMCMYTKEDFIKLLTPKEAKKFKEDFIEYFV